jgi:ABC-type polysaccharide/polyol phosphate transport system ATPase subunit
VSQPNLPAIDIQDVHREFRPERERLTLFRLVRALGRQPAAPPRQALRGVSLRIEAGEKIAIIGNNAAGKSTLLRIVAGLLRPTRGSATTQGEVVLITSLGAGMIDEVSVFDNTLMYGALYGVSPTQMRAVFDDVLDWAGMAGYAQAKVKTLSTGTRARLAFSVVRYIAADIFLIDEALSAGDVKFRARSRAFFDEPRNDSRTFVVATHDMDFARSFCRKTLWLDQGRIMAFGDSHDVVAQYLDAQR